RRNSAAIIVGSKHTYREIPDWAKGKCVYIPENGVSAGRLDLARDRTARLPLRAAFVGRLVPYKGADMLLEAAADFLRERQLELEIIGEGPQRALLEAMVGTLGIENRVHFQGWLSHVEVQRRLRNSDFLALPSVREFGGGVVVEAMSQGVTPI